MGETIEVDAEKVAQLCDMADGFVDESPGDVGGEEGLDMGAHPITDDIRKQIDDETDILKEANE